MGNLKCLVVLRVNRGFDSRSYMIFDLQLGYGQGLKQQQQQDWAHPQKDKQIRYH